MANGSFDLSSSTDRLRGKIVWSSQSNGAVANSSKVTATVYISRTDSYTTTGTWSYGFRVGSDVVFEEYYGSVSEDWVAIRTLTNDSVPHNDDGTGQCYIEAYVNGPSGTSMEDEGVSGLSRVTLDTIPRYTTINSFTVSKRNETSVTYSFTTADVCDYAYYSTDDGANWAGVDITDGKSASFVVDKLSSNTSVSLSPNTTYNFKVKVRRKDSGMETTSSRVQQTTYKVPSQSFSSKTETSITMSWSVDSTADYIWYSKDNGSNWTAVGSVNATSGSYTISNLTANTSYNIKTRVRRKAPQTTYDTSASTQTTFNYPYVSGVGSNPLTIGNSQTLTLYNPLNRSVTVRMYQNNTSGTQLYSGTTNTTSITFTPNASTLYASIPNSQDAFCVYSVIYGSSTKTTATNTTKYKIIGNENPTFSNFTYADINTTTTALTGNNQILVKGYSNVTATVSVANKAVPKNSASILNYVLSIGNQSAQANYSSSSDVTMTINNATVGEIKVTANDSRSLSTFVTKTATLKDYFIPATTELTATRGNNGVGEEVTLAFKGNWWNDSFGSVANAIQNIQYYFRKSTTDTWTTGSTTITWTTSGNTFSGSLVVYGDTTTHGFDVTSSYYIKIVVTDRLDHSVEYQTTIGSGTPAIAIYKDNVAIGKQYDTTQGGKMQVAGNLNVDGNIVQPLGANSTYLSGHFYHQLYQNNNYNIYEHFYPSSMASSLSANSTTANLRVWNGTNKTFKTLSFSGNGVLNWEGTIKQNNTSIVDLIYPVGAVYLSVNATSPATLFGGTWVQIKDGFLFCTTATSGTAGAQGNTESGNARTQASSGSTGGPSTNVTGDTTLTVDQIPSHSHKGYGWADVTDGSGNYRVLGAQGSSDPYGTRATGGGKAHSHSLNNHTHSLNSHKHNIPYTTVFVWKRTA